ncbi:MAG: FtsX-like permease family protein [Alphaproteobacteria bacterium]
MIRSYERQASFKYLTGRGGRFLSLSALFSLLGIAVGVAALIIASAFLNGQRDSLLDAIQGRSPHVVITALNPEAPAPICEPETDPINIALGVTERCTQAEAPPKGFLADDARIARVLGLSGISDVFFEVSGQGMVVLPSSGAVSGTFLRGLSEPAIKQRLAGNPQAYSASNSADLARDEVALGFEVAANLHPERRASLGLLAQTLDLVSPDGTTTIIGWTPRRRDVRVNIIFGGFAERNETYLPLESARTFLGFDEGRYNGLQLYLDDPNSVDDFARQVQAALNDDGFAISTWRDRNQAFVATLGIQRVVLMFVLALIVVVAAFNILASQIMLVRDKRKGIALLRTIGATSASVGRVFVGMGLFLAIFGCLLGLGIGLGVVLNFTAIVAFFAGIPSMVGAAEFLGSVTVTLSVGDTILAVAIALVITLLATLYPAWQASKTEPAEVLRYV